MLLDWSPTAVDFVRGIKHFFGLFSGTQIGGVPLDWPLRFVLLGGLHLLLRRRLPLLRAAAVGLGLLLATESLEIVATRTPGKLYWPDAGDVADLGSGLLGILAAERVRRLWRKPT